MNYQKYTIYILALLLISFATLVPGGPIETRDFSHLMPQVAWGFNTFLTSLGVLSIALIYFMAKRQKWAYQIASIFGFAYLLVYLLDLGKIFPVSSDPMSPLLFAIEIIGSILGILLMWTSYKAIKTGNKNMWAGKFKIPKIAIAIGMAILIIGALVLCFATASVLKG